MSKINLQDTGVTAITKMCEGNPGAMAALVEMINQGGRIDPDDLMGGFSAVLFLDTLGIYGTDIYVLYSDICGKSIANTLAVIRATQLGFFNGKTLADACSRQDYSGKDMVPVEDLYTKVKERLPNFDASGTYTM